MHNEERKQRYNIKYFVGCEDLLVKYIKETCGVADFSDEEILTALGKDKLKKNFFSDLVTFPQLVSLLDLIVSLTFKLFSLSPPPQTLRNYLLLLFVL
jgi:hypothetical protein